MIASKHLDINHLQPDIRHQLIEYLFLNLAYLLKHYNQEIHYGRPQYNSSGPGFTIFIFRVSFKTYDYAARCLEALGCKRVMRECGTTIAAISDIPGANIALKNQFMTLVDKAEERLALVVGDKMTPQYYYGLLKTYPGIIDIYSTDHAHFIVLEAYINSFYQLIWGELGLGKVMEKDGTGVANGRRERILVRFYKKRQRDKLLRYLMRNGVVDMRV